MKTVVYAIMVATISLMTGCISTICPPAEHSRIVETMKVTIGPEQGHIIQPDNKPLIGSLRIYIFDMQANTLEAILGDTQNSPNSSYTAQVKLGYKRIITLANMDKYPDAVITADDLLKSHEINWNTLLTNGLFPMYDDMTIEFTPYRKSATVLLKNAMSRVRLKKVTNALTEPNSGKEIDIAYAFLSNIPGTNGIKLSDGHKPGIWYNKYGRISTSPWIPIRYPDQSEVGEYGFSSIGKILQQGNTYEATDAGYMYTLPNQTQEDYHGMNGTIFTPRFTRLVVVTYIRGIVYYYPISLENLKPGYSYDVNLTIMKLGSDDPDTMNLPSSVKVGFEINEYTNNNHTDIEF